MFRIKTDIRQYKCETKDKVEKLIRNWVIRPNDLIYDADGKDWAPIGEHPAFVGLFGILDDQEKNTPDTVVTARSPYERDPEAPTNGHAEATPEEVTRMVGRPAVADSEAEDSRATDVFDQEEIAQSLSATAPAAPEPPTAPDGVEPPVNDGEVTMMTERTLEMLKITDEERDDAVDDDGDDDDEPRGSAKVIVDEEITGVRPRQSSEEERDEGDESEEEAAEDDGDAADEVEDGEPALEEDDEVEEDGHDEGEEPSNDKPEAAIESPADGEEDEEITGVRAREKTGEDDAVEEDAAVENPKVPGPPPKSLKEKVLESGPKLGRHDLPEELFATNEISSPEVQEQLKRLDELAELSEPSEPTKVEARSDDESAEFRLDEDSGVDEAWDVIAEDLRSTEEMGAAEAPTDEVQRDQDDDYDEDEWEDDTSEPHVAAADFVSDGYRISLPFPVRPTADDIRLGMPQGRVSKAVKDRTFPLPEPKKLNEIHRREFDLSPAPPRDHTWVIAAVVVLIVGFVMIVATC